MRRLFILGLLFGLVYILQFLQVGGEGAVSAQSLVSVGFILLAAYTLGEITSRFGLPKITGYILTGLIFGPYVVNLFSVQVVDNLKIINGLAIGLIALSAGGEMKVSSLKQIARSLTLLVLIKGGLILLAVMGAVYAVAASGMLPFLTDAPAALVLAVGGLFGVLAIGTSPAATIAVINETGSRGRLADTTLGVAVFKDVVMVVLLAIFIALTKVFSTPDAAFDPHVLLVVGEELGFSILAGAVLGGIILLYIRFINAEMWLFVIAIIFSMNTFAESFHLEALLLFITAGFIVQNFSKHGDDFVHLIESVALPVYVVFFSVAGAGLNLNALAQVGLVAGILVFVRVVAIFAGTRLATRLAGEPEAIQKNAWLSFISQAGVVIGLTIIIENNLPELGPEIRIVVLGTIAINLLAGPILFKMALAKVGETREQREDSAAADAPVPEDEDESGKPPPELPEPPSEIHYPAPAFDSPKLTAAALRVQEGLIHVQQDFQDQFIAQEQETLHTFLARVQTRYNQTITELEPQVTSTDDAQAQADLFREARIHFSEWLQSEVVAFGTRPERTEADEHAFEDFTAAVHLICQGCDERFVVIQESERFAPTPGDSPYVGFRKRLKRLGEGFSSFLGSGVRGTRTIPFQRIAHYQFDGLLPGDMVPIANLIGAAPLFLLDKIRILNRQIDEHISTTLDRLQPESGPPLPLDPSVFEQMHEAMAVEFEQALADVIRYHKDIEQRVAFALVQRYQAFLHDLDGAGTFELPARQRRFSLVYEDSQDAKQEIYKALDRWAAYTKGAAGNLAKQLDVVVLADHVGHLVDETVVRVSATIRERVGTHVATAQQACADSQQQLESAFSEKTPPDESKRLLASERQALLDTLDKQSIEPLEELRESRTLNALLDQMLRQFSDLATDVPESYTVVETEDLPSARDRGVTPSAPRLKMAPLRQVARDYLETRLARNLADANQMLFREVDAAMQALAEVRHLVRFNLQAAVDELDAATPKQARARDLALDGLARARTRLNRTEDQIEYFAGAVYHQIHESTHHLIPAINEEVTGRTEIGLRMQDRQQQLLDQAQAAAQRTGEGIRESWRRFSVGLRRRFRPLTRDLLRDLRATLPLHELEPKETLDRYDQAALNTAHFERLPFIYQKLFDFTPLETDDFLVACEAEKALFQLALRRWKNGEPTPVGIIGEPGSGLSSFLHTVQRQVKDFPVHQVTFTQMPSSEEALVRLLARRMDLPRAHNLDELTRLILSGAGTDTGSGRSVVMLEDVHRLYRRAPGGFDLLRGLLLLIATTGERVLWVLSMNQHAWHYLDAVVHLADTVAFTISVKPLTRDTLEEAVMARHRFSGLDLYFAPSETMQHRRTYRRASEDEQQAMNRAAFFDQLYRLSGGNPLAGLFFWRKAIAEVEEHQLTIRPMLRPLFGYVRGLDVNALLTLVVVLQQGVLTVEDHARLFGLPPAESHALLMHLTSLHLLTRHDRTHPVTFRLNTPIYKPLVRELEALNLPI